MVPFSGNQFNHSDKLFSSDDDDDMLIRTMHAPHPYRVRTRSLQSHAKISNADDFVSHLPARRTTSALTSSTKPIIRNNDWYNKTQELFRSLHYSNSSKLSSKSSRLTSHHSSSSEEWYLEFQDKNTDSQSHDNQLNIDDKGVFRNRISYVSEEKSENTSSDRSNNSKVLQSTIESSHIRPNDKNDELSSQEVNDNQVQLSHRSNKMKVKSKSDNENCLCSCNVM